MHRIHHKQQGVKKSGAAAWAYAVGLVLSLVLNAVCVLLFMEWIGRDSMSSTIIFLVEQAQFAACSALIILLASMTLLFLIGRVAPALAVYNSFFLILSIINHYKIELRDEPFQPMDLTMVGEALGVLGNTFDSSVSITAPILQGVAILCVLVPLLFIGMRVLRGRGRLRAGCLLLSAAMLGGCGMFVVQSPSMKLDRNLNIRVVIEDYNLRGFLVAFISRAANSSALPKPEDYTEERVTQVLADYAPALGEPALKPNILFLMSETLFDMTGILDLSEDPLAYFKQLQQEYWGGRYISPVYGGGTVAAEYEVLTGYRVQDTDGLSYTAPGHVMQDGMLSIVSLLKSYGYYAQAIHPGERNFYSRTNAYRMLGFDSALFRDDLDPVPKDVFPFPSDAYMFDQIIKLYEGRPKDQPWFCHAITYQNHGGYDFQSDLNRISVGNALDDTSMLSARNYVNMLQLSDEALASLIAYFDAQEEPTIIVMWGDHSPYIYRFGLELPVDQKEKLENYYSTPMMIYSNFDLDTSCLPESISSYRLGAFVLRMLGMDGDAYFNYLSSDEMVNLTLFDGLLERNGAWVKNDRLYEQTKDTLRLLHYDRLYGKRYGVSQ
ncbi:MAG: LTA synthase family protein [Candidatus Ventricola sp.]